MKRDFIWVDYSDPHRQRRREMLSKYPQIAKLFGHCRYLKYLVIAMILVQVLLAYSLEDASWWLMLLMAFCVGGVINHSLLLAIHELSHNIENNRRFACTNLTIGIPMVEWASPAL